MSLNTTTPGYCCLQLEVMMDQMFGELAPSRIRQDIEYVNVLKSERNTTGMSAMELNQFGGKARPQTGQLPKFTLKWRAPQCGGVTGTTPAGLCAAQPGYTNPWLYDDVEVTQVRSVGGTISKADFLQICENPSEALAREIADAAYNLMYTVNQDLIAAHYAVSGNYPSDGSASTTAAKTIPLVNAAGHVNLAAFAKIFSEYRLMHTSQRPIIVGGNFLGMVQDVRELGGLGANAIGAQQTSVPPFSTDFAIDSVIQGLAADTNSHVLSWVPGAVQLLEWYRYDDEVYQELGKQDYAATTLTIDGWTFDYTLKYDECTEAWTWELSKYFELCCVPDSHYAACYNFNHKLHWIVDCGDTDCTTFSC